MSNQHQSRSGCGRMLLVLFGFVFFVVMGLLIWLVYTSRSLEEEIRAKGEPVTLAELDAWYTAVPDDKNAALVDGRLPDSLDALVPKYLDALPLDPFDERPLRYMRGDYGYLVYSIGPNLQDEQGMEPARNARHTGDIVIRVTR